MTASASFSISRLFIPPSRRSQLRRMLCYTAIVFIAFVIICAAMQRSESVTHSMQGSRKIKIDSVISAESPSVSSLVESDDVFASEDKPGSPSEMLAKVVGSDGFSEGSNDGVGFPKLQVPDASASEVIYPSHLQEDVPEMEGTPSGQPPPATDGVGSGEHDASIQTGVLLHPGSALDTVWQRGSTERKEPGAGLQEHSEGESWGKDTSSLEGVQLASTTIQSVDLPRMDDDELIQKALALHKELIGKKTPGPSKSVESLGQKLKKVRQCLTSANEGLQIAFLFLVRGAIPLAPLWDRFFRGHQLRYLLYIHASNQSNSEEEEQLPVAFRGRHIQAQPVTWGGFDMVTAERRLFANAFLDPTNRFFVLVSESCIPVYNFRAVYRYMSKSKYSFMANMVDPNANVTWKPNFEPEVPMEAWRKGDEWKELHRGVVAVLLKDTKYFKKFYDHYGCPDCVWARGKGFADERYMPTLLNLKRPLLLANRTLTYVDWNSASGDKFHPKTFTNDDVTEQALQEIRGWKSCHLHNVPTNPLVDCSINGVEMPCFLFARKFSEESLPNLLKLAKSVLGY